MKLIFLYSAGLLLLAAGCTKIDKEPSGEEWVWDESLPVPISFEPGGGLSVETKAAITDLEGQDIGLFAMSVNKVKDDPDNNNKPNWKFADEVGTGTRLLINEKVQTDENGTIVVKDKYYPNDNQYNYSFYAYAPYSDSYEPGTGWERVNFDLGETDIIYGDAHASILGSGVQNKEFGFKASYIRYVKGSLPDREDLLPKINFKHLLTGMSFYAMLAEEGEGEGESNVTVKSIRIINTATSVSLYIADNNWDDADGNMTGKFRQRGENGTLFVRGSENALDHKLHYNDYNEGSGPIGQLFLMPGNDYKIRVDYETATEGEPVSTFAEAELSRAGGFVAGTNYSIKLKITPLAKMEINTDITDWKSQEGPEISLGGNK